MLTASSWSGDKAPPSQTLSEAARRASEAPLATSLMDSLVSMLGPPLGACGCADVSATLLALRAAQLL
jgi:hypothetical protein